MRLSRTVPLLASLALLLSTGAAVSAADTDVLDLTLLAQNEPCSVYFDPDFEEKLTEQQALLFAALSDALPAREETVDIRACGYTDADELGRFLEKVLNSEFTLVNVSDKAEILIEDGVIAELCFTYPERAAVYSTPAFASVEEAVAHALACVKDDMQPVEKALLLHEYIVRETDYNLAVVRGEMEYPDYVHSAEGVFLYRDAVCEGYAKAYSLLLKEVDIPSVLVASDEMNHAWNMVKIGDNWFHADVTWDDPTNDAEVDFCRGGFVNHAFFLQSDKYFEDPGEHYEWTLLNWSELTGEAELPQSAVEDAFKGWCFRPIPETIDDYSDVGHITYIDGWYYALSTPYGSDTLRKSRIDGTELSTIKLARRYDYLFYLDGYFYASDANNIYELNSDGTENRIVASPVGTIANFWLKMDKLEYYEVDASGNAFIRTVDLEEGASNTVEQDGMIFVVDRTSNTAALIDYKGTAQNLVIPAEVEGCSVISIKPYAITGDDTVRSVALPDTVIEICDYAFFKTKFTFLELSSSLKRIGNFAVFNNWYLTELTIPASVEEIGIQAFSYCWNLTDVHFEGAVPSKWGMDIFLTDFSNGYQLPTIHFTYGEEGWTYPTWTDKYGTEYKTSTVLPKEFTVTGKITSYGDSSVSALVQLILVDEETGAETVVSEDSDTADGTYSVTAPAGEYLLRVQKKNHVTRTYRVLLGN